MNQEQLMMVIRAPIVSEKSARITEKNNQVAFKVATTATKPQIKQAVETLFDVEVEGVQVVNCTGKRKMFARRPGKRSDWKKAYVRLKAGSAIDFVGA